MAIIYLVTDLINQKFYVGQTIHSIEKRWREHCKQAQRGGGAALQEAIRRQGSSAFATDILAHDVAPSMATPMEKIWVILMQSRYPYGYNMNAGGVGAAGWDAARRMLFTDVAKERWKNPEYRAKQSASQKRRWANPIHHEEMMKICASAEHRLKMSEGIRRVQDTEEYKKLADENNHKNAAVQARKSASMARNAAADPEVAKRCADRSNAMWKDPQMKERLHLAAKRRGARDREAFIGRMKNLWSDPEFRARESAKRSDRAKALWKKRKQARS